MLSKRNLSIETSTCHTERLGAHIWWRWLPDQLSHYLTVLLLLHSQGGARDHVGTEAPTPSLLPPSPSNQAGGDDDEKLSLTFSHSLIPVGQRRSNIVRIGSFQLAKDHGCMSYPGLTLVSPFCLLTVAFMNETLGGETWKDCACYLTIFFREERLFQLKQSVYATAPNTDGTRGLDS